MKHTLFAKKNAGYGVHLLHPSLQSAQMAEGSEPIILLAVDFPDDWTFPKIGAERIPCGPHKGELFVDWVMEWEPGDETVAAWPTRESREEAGEHGNLHLFRASPQKTEMQG